MLLIAEQHSFLMYSAVTRLIFSLSIQAGHELLFLCLLYTSDAADE